MLFLLIRNIICFGTNSLYLLSLGESLCHVLSAPYLLCCHSQSLSVMYFLSVPSFFCYSLSLSVRFCLPNIFFAVIRRVCLSDSVCPVSSLLSFAEPVCHVLSAFLSFFYHSQSLSVMYFLPFYLFFIILRACLSCTFCLFIFFLSFSEGLCHVLSAPYLFFCH